MTDMTSPGLMRRAVVRTSMRSDRRSARRDRRSDDRAPHRCTPSGLALLGKRRHPRVAEAVLKLSPCSLHPVVPATRRQCDTRFAIRSSRPAPVRQLRAPALHGPAPRVARARRSPRRRSRSSSRHRDGLTEQHAYPAPRSSDQSVADSACGYAALSLMEPGVGVLSVEFKVNMLAPAIGDRFVATGRVVRAGRTLTVCSAEVTTERDGATVAVLAHAGDNDVGAGQARGRRLSVAALNGSARRRCS